MNNSFIESLEKQNHSVRFLKDVAKTIIIKFVTYLYRALSLI